MSDTIYLDQMQNIACRNVDELIKGESIILVHTPSASNPDDVLLFGYDDYILVPRYTIATVKSVERKTFDEIHGYTVSTSSVLEEQLVLFFDTPNGKTDYIYATDTGLEPYSSGMVNDTNYVIRLETLKQFGEDSVLGWSPGYIRAIDARNALTPSRAAA